MVADFLFTPLYRYPAGARMSSEQSDISDRDATSTFVALRYWARASQYQPTESEKVLLTECEARSNRYWQAGMAVGTGGGLGLASVARVSLVQRAAVTGAFASAASFYGQYKANKPCLLDIFELGRTTPSPLDVQARQILAVGSTATIERLHIEQQQQQRQQQRPQTPPQQHHPPLAAEPLQAVTGATAGAGTFDVEPASSPQVAPQATPAPLSAHNGSSAVSSWEAVRQRHQARLAGDVETSASGRVGQPLAAEPEYAAAGAPPRRARRNQYGDEIVE